MRLASLIGLRHHARASGWLSSPRPVRLFILKSILPSVTWAVAVTALFFASAAFAEPITCAQSKTISKHLAEEYGEVRAGAGLTNQGMLMTLWVGVKTWSLVISTPAGLSCLVAVGGEWRPIHQRKRGPAL